MTERTTFAANNQALHQHSVVLQQHVDRLTSESSHYRHQVVGLQNHLERIAVENQELSRYRLIVDVEREVQLRRASLHAVEVAASQQAAAVVAEAYARAQAIAGDALDAKRNVEVYRREVQALKNVIQGYGDQYLVETDGILDGLGEAFGHTDAGAKLKEARQRSRTLVKSGTAAACDYVEPDRRQAAVDFIVDAFNGKAETILSKVKVDNFGTLCQEIEDAATLVNKNGRAFRGARVLRAYVESRLDELRWALIVHELREREREEQRRLKEQIREEEKVRKEYERAQKEAAREEEVIRRAMARAQQEIEHATDAQRAKYEGQLAELALKLQAAEEKNQRALSMAQQTKRGHVYIISNVGSFGEHVFKIGLTRRLEPVERIKELGDASVPFDFDVHALIVSDDAPALERTLHRHFISAQLNKVNPRKEFFRADLTMIRGEVEKLGIQASWTMTAAAMQYRETLAIERAIKDDPAARQAWLNRQLVLDPVSSEEIDEYTPSNVSQVGPEVAIAS